MVWIVVTLQLPVWLSTKISNHNILVSAHPIWELKIVPEISLLREFMVRNPFWNFECFTSVKPCDSSTSPKANIWPVTLEKFWRHGFSVFHLNHPFYFKSWISIEVKFWLVNIKNSALGLKHPSWAQVEKISKSWRRIGFQKNSMSWIHT